MTEAWLFYFSFLFKYQKSSTITSCLRRRRYISLESFCVSHIKMCAFIWRLYILFSFASVTVWRKLKFKLCSDEKLVFKMKQKASCFAQYSMYTVCLVWLPAETAVLLSPVRSTGGLLGLICRRVLNNIRYSKQTMWTKHFLVPTLGKSAKRVFRPPLWKKMYERQSKFWVRQLAKPAKNAQCISSKVV